jgi:hypothetical protein
MKSLDFKEFDGWKFLMQCYYASVNMNVIGGIQYSQLSP